MESTFSVDDRGFLRDVSAMRIVAADGCLRRVESAPAVRTGKKTANLN